MNIRTASLQSLLYGSIIGTDLQPLVWRFGRLFKNKLNSKQKEVIQIEVKINKEVRNYQESLFFGLNLRQFIFSVLAVAASVGVYFALKAVFGSVGDWGGWLCVLAAFPFALCGFFQYNGLTFEQFVWAFLRSEILCPPKLVFRTDNLYAKMLASSSVKEALKID